MAHDGGITTNLIYYSIHNVCTTLATQYHLKAYCVGGSKCRALPLYAVKLTKARASLAQPDSYTSGGGGRESGKVPYIELSQRLVRGATNQIASLWHCIVCGGVSDYERTRYHCARVFILRSQSDMPPQTKDAI